AVVKISYIEHRLVVCEALLDSGVGADAFFRLQIGIVGKSQLETVGRADSGAEAAVQASDAEKAGIGLMRGKRRGNPRIYLGHGCGRDERPRRVVFVRGDAPDVDIINANAGANDPPCARIPSVLGKKR